MAPASSFPRRLTVVVWNVRDPLRRVSEIGWCVGRYSALNPKGKQFTCASFYAKSANPVTTVVAIALEKRPEALKVLFQLYESKLTVV